MPTHSDRVAQELKQHGYAVVRGFLSDADVSPELLAFLGNAGKFFDGVISDIPGADMAPIRERIAGFVPAVADSLGLSISRERYSYSAIRIQQAAGAPTLVTPFNVHRDPKKAPGGVLNWHLDHFSYYLFGDHTNWLICYMPVMKPSRTLANLAIVPSSVVRELDPELQRRIEGRGAMRFRCVEPDTIDWFRMRFPREEDIAVGDWFAIDDYHDATMGWKIAVDLERHKVVPELDEHDLLIMRADVIHRTNDAGTDRISLRCDAVPLRAPRFDTWPGLLNMTLRFPFVGRKRRYNLRQWLKKAWRTRLSRA